MSFALLLLRLQSHPEQACATTCWGPGAAPSAAPFISQLPHHEMPTPCQELTVWPGTTSIQLAGLLTLLYRNTHTHTLPPYSKYTPSADFPCQPLPSSLSLLQGTSDRQEGKRQQHLDWVSCLIPGNLTSPKGKIHSFYLWAISFSNTRVWCVHLLLCNFRVPWPSHQQWRVILWEALTLEFSWLLFLNACRPQPIQASFIKKQICKMPFM